MRHGVKSLWESWCRAECAPGRTWAAEGNGRRPIVCTRNRTDPISGCAKNGDAPELTKPGTPLMTEYSSASVGSVGGLGVKETLINPPIFPDKDAKKLAGVLYHESRHAEQHALIAQWHAMHEKDAAGIAEKMGIPLAKDKGAVRSP